jgi:hypothetical protein
MLNGALPVLVGFGDGRSWPRGLGYVTESGRAMVKPALAYYQSEIKDTSLARDKDRTDEAVS